MQSFGKEQNLELDWLKEAFVQAHVGGGGGGREEA